MKYKISLCISALCFFTAFLILMASRTTGEEALASRIAPEIPVSYTHLDVYKRQRVILVHELGQLGASEELLHSRSHGLDVD